VWEETVLRRLNAAKSVVFLNKRNGDKSNLFNTNGTAHAKDAATGERLGTVSIHDPRWKSGEIVGVRRGARMSDEAKAKMSAYRKNTAIGIITATGEHKRISLEDPRWRTGEVVSILKGVKLGQPQTVEHIKRRSESRKRNGKKTSPETRSKWSVTRKGKKPAYTKMGEFVGLVNLHDDRWGTALFTKQQVLTCCI
jgi:hypothetical protein